MAVSAADPCTTRGDGSHAMYCEDVRRIADWAKRWPTIPAVLTHTCESIARKSWFGSEEERFALPDEVIELGR